MHFDKMVKGKYLRGVYLFLILFLGILNIHGVEANSAPTPTQFNEYTNMVNVDLATGNPSVSIPIMNVPGRGGLEYPLVLSYGPGIKLEQTPDWVGLGWELGTHAVIRNVRGVPDDHECFATTFQIGLDEPWWRIFTDHIDWIFNYVKNGGEIGVCVGNACGGYYQKLAFQFGTYVYATVMNPAIYFPTFVMDLEGLELAAEQGEVKTNNRGIHGKYYANSADCGAYESGEYDDHDSFFFTGPAFSSKMFKDGAGFKFLKKSNDREYDMLYDIQGTDGIDSFILPDLDGTEVYFEEAVYTGSAYTRSGTKDWDSNYCSCNSGDCFMKISFEESFASVWKVSKILSHDYSDSDGIPGPSDGDQGNWIKFGYTDIYNLADPFTSKFPFDGGCADGATGNSFKTYSTSELSVLDYIETPTHIAYFNTDQIRDDGNEAGGTKKLPKLSSIELYSKNNLGQYISKMEFVYDYSLVPNTPESASGRMTLKEVIMHGYPDGHTLPSYSFEYNGPNPSYSQNKFDRWGNYYSSGGSLSHNKYGLEAGTIPEAWSLTDITWPSGGSTSINYESDRYDRVNHWYSTGMPGNSDFMYQTHYGGGVRAESIENCDGFGGCYANKYLYVDDPIGKISSGNWIENDDDGYGGAGDSSGSIPNDLPSYSRDKQRHIVTGSPYQSTGVTYSQVSVIPGYTGADSLTSGFSVFSFKSTETTPNAGADYDSIPEEANWRESCMFPGKDFGVCPGENGNIYPSHPSLLPLFVGPPNGHFNIIETANGRFVDEFDVGPEGYTHYRPPAQGWSEYQLLHTNTGNSAAIYISNSPSDYSCFSRESYGDSDYNGICDMIEFDKFSDNDAFNYGDYTNKEHYIGLGFKKESYNNNFELISSTDTEYQDIPVFNSADRRFGFSWIPADRQTEMLDGVETTTQYEYNEENGLPRKTTVHGNHNKDFVTYNTYAYESSSSAGMATDHMLTQGQLVVVGDENTEFGPQLSDIQGAMAVTETRYDDNFGNGAWRLDDVRNWGDIDGDGIIDTGEMKTASNIISYDNYGNVLRAQDALGNDALIYYGGSGSCDNSNTLFNAYPTCIENELGHQIKTHYNNKFYISQISDPANSANSYYFYDEFNRLKEVRPVGESVSTIFYDYNYGLDGGCTGGLEEDSGNGDPCMNWIQTKAKMEADKESTSRGYVDGLGRHLQSKALKDSTTALETRTYYNSMGLIDSVTEPTFENIGGWRKAMGGIFPSLISEEQTLSFTRGRDRPTTEATNYFYYGEPMARTKKIFPSNTYGDENVACDENNPCVEFKYNDIVMFSDRIAGNGQEGYQGDGLPADSDYVRLNNPRGVHVDSAGNIYIADTGNHRLRYIPANSGTHFGESMQGGYIYTILGTGSDYFNGCMVDDPEEDSDRGMNNLYYPIDVSVDSSGNVYVVDSDKRVVRLEPSGIAQTVVGCHSYRDEGEGCWLGGNVADGCDGYSAYGAIIGENYGTGAGGIEVDSEGNLYIPEMGAVRFVPASSGYYFGISMQGGNIYTIAGHHSQYGDSDGTSSAGNSRLNGAGDIAIIDGFPYRAFVIDGGNQKIRRIADSGYIETILSSNQVTWPDAIDIDSNYDLHVASYNKIDKFDFSGNSEGVFIGEYEDCRVLGDPGGIAFSANNELVITDLNKENIMSFPTHYTEFECNFRKEEVVDGLGNSVLGMYNKFGHLIEAADQLGNIQKFERDIFGNLLIYNDAEGRLAMSNKYNTLGQLTRTWNIDSYITDFEYDDNGNVYTVKTPNGDTILNTYDNLNRLDGVLVFARWDGIWEPRTWFTVLDHTYDGCGYSSYETGRLCRIQNNLYNNELRYVYDQKGNVDIVREIINGVEYTTDYEYDLTGNIKSILNNEGSLIEYEYNLLGQLWKIYLNGDVIEYQYNADNSIDFIDYSSANGAYVDYAYDTRKRIEEIQIDGASGNLFEERYLYDEVGNLRKIEDWGPGENGAYTWFEYDDLYRLEKVDSGNYYLNNFDIDYLYDNVGNRLSRTVSSNDGSMPVWTDSYDYGIEGGQPNGNEQNNKLYTTDADDCTYDYDAAGNIRAKVCGNGATKIEYRYDFNNLMNEIVYSEWSSDDQRFVETGVYLVFEYDALGRRVRKVHKICSNPDDPATCAGLDTAYSYGLGMNPIIEDTQEYFWGES
jgi:hypothetical protein